MGKILLKERNKIILTKPKTIQKTFGKIAENDLSFDAALFRELQVLRKALADQKNVPPFVIFTDVALREMSHYFPHTSARFQKISGVGAMKLTQYGEQFLKIIQTYTREHNKEELPIPSRTTRSHKTLSSRGTRTSTTASTYQKTKELFLQKLSLPTIAKERGLSIGTILTHLEKLTEDGENIDIAYLKLPAEDLTKIQAAFKKSGGFALTPVHKALEENFSYDELRLARIFIKSTL